MASKSKHRSKVQDSALLVQQAQRNLEKRWFKEALKGARLCYRQEATPENRQLLARALLARTDELERAGLHKEACDTAAELLSLGDLDSPVAASLPALLARLGMLDKLPKQEGATDTRTEALVADTAVQHPERCQSAGTDIKEGARLVRSAFDALERGDDGRGALELLQGVSRQSPFADWRLFLRGLAAGYRGDAADRTACWERLTPERTPSRLAAALRAIVEGKPVSATDYRLRDAVASLELSVLGTSVIDDLRSLRDCVAAGDWDRGLKLQAVLREKLRQISPDFPERVTEVFYTWVTRHGSWEQLEELIRTAQPLSIDPRWNRARAMFYERSNYHASRIGEAWTDYLADISKGDIIPAAERPTALALIWMHIADCYLDDAVSDDEDDDDEEEDENELEDPFDVEFSDEWEDDENDLACLNRSHSGDRAETRRLRKRQGIAALRSAVAAAPELTIAHVNLAKALDLANDLKGAADVRKSLLQRWPEHAETLEALSFYESAKGRGDLAAKYADRLLRLRPLDSDTTLHAWMMHLGAARYYAKKKKWKPGRGEFAAAERLGHVLHSPLPLLTQRAVFEQLAGDTQAAAEWQAKARAAASQSDALGLMLAVEGRRYGLPVSAVRQFEAEWHEQLAGEFCSDVAATSCSILLPFVITGESYPGHKTHLRELLAYLQQHRRAKYRSAPLRSVCEFLQELDKKPFLFAELIRNGFKSFPKEPFFCFQRAMLELDSSFTRNSFKSAKKNLEKALNLAGKSGDPADKALIPAIRQELDDLEQAEVNRRSNPFGFPFDSGFGFPGEGGSSRGKGAFNWMRDILNEFIEQGKGNRIDD